MELIKTVISGDNLLHGPTDDIFINLKQSDGIAIQAMRRLFPELTQWDVQRDTVTISAEGQHQAQQLLNSLPMTPAMRRRKRDRVDQILDDIPGTLLVEMYDVASHFPGTHEDYSHDHIALMIPHFLSFIDRELDAKADDWGITQALATLWLFHDHDVMPEKALLDYTERLVIVIETRLPNWIGAPDGWFPANWIIQAVEEMDTHHWKDSAQALKLLDMTEQLIVSLDENDLGSCHKRLQHCGRNSVQPKNVLAEHRTDDPAVVAGFEKRKRR